MNKTSIEWTHRPETGGESGGFTWNPIRARLKVCPDCGHRHDLTARACWQLQTIEGGTQRCLCETKQTGTFCTRISPGCTHCYASTINKRFGNGLEYTVPNLEKVEFFIDEKILAEPLKRKKPATIFVGDMFDLFHEAIPDDMVGHVFALMAQCPQHTFQVLTKRADVMLDLLSDADAAYGPLDVWPLPNVWCGVSVESQKYADERIPLLLQIPAAVRFLSVEPMLEAVDLTRLPSGPQGRYLDSLRGIYVDPKNWQQNTCTSGLIDWVICGGESGPGARPFNLAWAESLQAQCKDAGVPFFMKQVGSSPFKTLKSHAMGIERNGVQLPDELPMRLKDRKGGDPAEWPEHLRVREFPSSGSLPVEGQAAKKDSR